LKTRIEDAAKEYGDKAMGNMSPRNDNYGISHYNLIQGFIAGAEFMQGEVDKIKEKNEIISILMYKLYNALNCAHGYIDPYENKRTDKICMEALCEYEAFKKVGEV
jgi:hypothetical protein